MMLIEFEVPQLEREYGFRGGWLDVPTTQGQRRQAFGIVTIEPAGRLASYGFREGDIPVAHHGDGLAWFCEALVRARLGEGTSLWVFNVYEPAESETRRRQVSVGSR
jgi:hypothetical protein